MKPKETIRPAQLSSPPATRRAAKLTALAALSAVWGPGLLVMLADTDAGNIITAADAGTQWGYRLLPLPILLIPALAMIQDLAVRIGIFTGQGFGELIRLRLGRLWGWVAAAALCIAAVASLITELTGIAGVGELYGVPRAIALMLTSLGLLLVVLTGQYRRIERIALVIGLFEFSFFFVAWIAHPTAGALVHDIIDQKLTNGGYLYLGAGLIGATFNPWMIFYQSSALVEKRLSPPHYSAAKWDTIIGACLTQSLTAAVVLAVAAVAARHGASAALDSVGAISNALTPVLGETIGRLIFGIGVTGAALAAAIVCSLACAWGLGEIFGRRGSRERDTTRSGWFLTGYSACITGSAAIVLFVPDLVWLSVATQVLNAIMLPVVGMLLVIVAATALPPEAVLKGAPLWLTTAMIGLVSAAGLIGAIAGLQ